MSACNDIRLCLLFNELSIDKIEAMTGEEQTFRKEKTKLSKNLTFRYIAQY